MASYFIILTESFGFDELGSWATFYKIQANNSLEIILGWLN